MAAIGAGEGNLDAMALHKPEKIVVAVRETIEIVMGAAHKKLAKDGYKGEIFNVTDRANFASPTGDQASANFLRVTSLSTSTNPRTGQFGVRFGF